MPLFALADGRAHLVRPAEPSPEAFAVEADALLGDHLDTLLAQSVFVVRDGDDRDNPDRPTVLGLDGAGRPVVVDVVHLLDRDAVTSALRKAGAAARLTAADLARLYHSGDGGRFEHDFAAFRAHLPFAQRQPGAGGARVVLVCAHVAPQAADEVSACRARGERIDVLQVGVVLGADGRRLLTVDPPMATAGPEPDEASPATTAGQRGAVDPSAGAAGQRAVATGLSAVAGGHGGPSQSAVDPAGRRRAQTRGASRTTHATRVASGAYPELAELAAAVHAPVQLIWSRLRRGQRLVAWLREDGLITVPSGETFDDPSQAAAAVARSDVAVDGWTAWRLGVDGPTLAESIEALYAEPARVPGPVAPGAGAPVAAARQLVPAAR